MFNGVISSGHNLLCAYNSLYAEMHVGVIVCGFRHSLVCILYCIVLYCNETYNRKSLAVEWILVKSGKILSPVLEIVL